MTFEFGFLIVFFLQVTVISLYFPNRIIQRSYEFIEQYPPDVYPRMYGWPVERWFATIRRYQAMTRVVFAIGLLIWAGIAVFGVPGSVKLMLVLWVGYFALQVGCNVWRRQMVRQRMQAVQVDQLSIRSAELKPRRVLDYSPAALWCAVLLSLTVALLFVAAFALQGSLLQGLVLGSITLGMNWLCFSSTRQAVAGGLDVPGLIGPVDKHAFIGKVVNSTADTMIRTNLGTAVFAAALMFGIGYYLVIVVSALFLWDSSYEFYRELQLRDEQIMDMEAYRQAPST